MITLGLKFLFLKLFICFSFGTKTQILAVSVVVSLLLQTSPIARSQCYVRGAGGDVYTLRIPGPGSYVDCGTERVSNMHLIIFKRLKLIKTTPKLDLFSK